MSARRRHAKPIQTVLRIFLRTIAQSLQTHCPGAAQVDKTALHIGAVAFIHRFGSSLNQHVHFHVCEVDGVLEEVAASVIFHLASGIDQAPVAQVQTTLRRCILSAFVGRACWRAVTPKTCWPTSTAASRSMPVSASSHTPVLLWNVCCGTAPVHPLLATSMAAGAHSRRLLHDMTDMLLISPSLLAFAVSPARVALVPAVAVMQAPPRYVRQFARRRARQCLTTGNAKRRS